MGKYDRYSDDHLNIRIKIYNFIRLYYLIPSLILSAFIFLLGFVLLKDDSTRSYGYIFFATAAAILILPVFLNKIFKRAIKRIEDELKQRVIRKVQAKIQLEEKEKQEQEMAQQQNSADNDDELERQQRWQTLKEQEKMQMNDMHDENQS